MAHQLAAIDARKVIEETLALLSTHQIKFVRSDPGSFFSDQTRTNCGLTLPLVPPESLPTVVLLKNVYALWNCAVDDDIDRGQSSVELDRSAAVLVRGRVDGPSLLQGTAALLQAMLSRLPQARDEETAIVRFDLLEVIHGFQYEFQINRSHRLASSAEYRRYSTMTASFKLHLDIDMAFCASRLDDRTYRALRSAYDVFSIALKYASDIGSLKRELVDEDNLNSVRIRGLETGVEADRLNPADAKSVDSKLAELREATAYARAQMSDELARGRSIMESLSGFDVGLVFETLTGVIDVYSSGRDAFFKG